MRHDHATAIGSVPHDVVVEAEHAGFQRTVVIHADVNDEKLSFTLEEEEGRIPAGAKLVASVCTGSFILAAAGVLQGKRATSHWAARETLAAFGVTPVNERVVRDGKFISGAGISAGLDAGVAITEALRGRPYAEAQMLQAEYAPSPPFAGGRPDNTRPEITGAVQSLLGGFNGRARAIAQAR